MQRYETFDIVVSVSLEKVCFIILVVLFVLWANLQEITFPSL